MTDGSSPDIIRLFHGTSRPAAERIVQEGFRRLDVQAILCEIATAYDVVPEVLTAATMRFVTEQRPRDLYIHLTTNPQHAASYARRGAEVAYMAREAVYRLRNPRGDLGARDWERRAATWAKAEEARSVEPALVILDVPADALPSDQRKKIDDTRDMPDFVQNVVYFVEVLLMPEEATPWIWGLATVEPCTCWRDGRPCPACGEPRSRWDGSGWNGKMEPVGSAT